MPTPETIYQLKITLLGTTPPVWRRVLIPSSLTLSRLQDVIQGRFRLGQFPRPRVYNWRQELLPQRSRRHHR